MIKASELRLGNWVNHNETNTQIATIDSDNTGNFIGVLETENHYYRMSFKNDGDLQPIPLTPEVLERCGFKKEGLQCEYSNGKTDIHIYDDGYRFGQNGYPFGISIKYLHQLQNLYFALTGEELIVHQQASLNLHK